MTPRRGDRITAYKNNIYCTTANWLLKGTMKTNESNWLKKEKYFFSPEFLKNGKILRRRKSLSSQRRDQGIKQIYHFLQPTRKGKETQFFACTRLQKSWTKSVETTPHMPVHERKLSPVCRWGELQAGRFLLNRKNSKPRKGCPPGLYPPPQLPIKRKLLNIWQFLASMGKSMGK